ncbi:MAG: P1 family peptidase, partial [Thermoanaerobaculia bacterium]
MSLDRRQVLQLGPLALAGLAGKAEGKALTGRFRARDLGVRIGRLTPGPWNAITDVPGVEVGHQTIIQGSGTLVPGTGPIRTGVTAIWPSRRILKEYLPCGYDVPNGNGEVTGLIQLRSLGILGSPICLTNTSSVGMVYDALLDHLPDDDLPPVEPV